MIRQYHDVYIGIRVSTVYSGGEGEKRNHCFFTKIEVSILFSLP